MRTVVLAVGTRLAESERAFQRLVLALVIGLPLFAGLVSLGGWFLAGAALSPVRSMIEEADDLSVREPGRRLTVPASGGTEIAELAQRLNEMLARIEAAVAHERSFLDDASHELRTPLAILRGEVELARMGVADGTEQAATLDSVMEEVLRLQALTTDLLVLARTRTGTSGPRPEADLGTVAESAVASVRRAGVAGSIDITASGHTMVRGDEDALERAVTNIVENACRYARPTSRSSSGASPVPRWKAARAVRKARGGATGRVRGWRCATTAPDSRPSWRRPGRSSGSRGPRARGGRVRAWAWRSWGRSWPPTGARWRRRTLNPAAPSSEYGYRGAIDVTPVPGIGDARRVGCSALSASSAPHPASDAARGE